MNQLDNERFLESEGVRSLASDDHSTQDGASFNATHFYLDVDDGNNDFISERVLRIAEFLEKTAEQLKSHVSRHKLNKKKTQRPKKKRIPPHVAENIFVITCILQMLCIAGLELTETLATKFIHIENTWYIVGIVIGVVFQLTNLFLSLIVTVKLTKQYLHHNASMRFLLQSYLSTLFLFGGIYTFIAREWPHTFLNLRGKRNERFYTLRLYSQLLFTSISTGTLCGAASVVAIHWITEILMSFQMLLSFIYFASILSQVINPPLEPSTNADSTSLLSCAIIKNRRQEQGYKTC